MITNTDPVGQESMEEGIMIIPCLIIDCMIIAVLNWIFPNLFN
jgi:hypothetical protein